MICRVFVGAIDAAAKRMEPFADVFGKPSESWVKSRK